MTEPVSTSTAGGDRLASAVARIAEEQLAEQRMLAGLVGDLRAQLARLETLPIDIDAALAGRTTELAAAVVERLTSGDPSGVQGQLADVAAVLIALHEQFDDLRTADSPFDTLASLPGDIAVLTGDLAALTGRLDAASDASGTIDAATAIEEMKTLLGDIRTATEATPRPETAPLAELVTAVSVTAAGVAALAESVATLNADIALIARRLDEVDHRMGAVARAEGTAALTDEVAGLRADFDNVRRLLLEDLPSDGGIDAAALAADLSGPLGAAVTGTVTDAIDTAVGRFSARQGQSEARLISHVDEAVLALAEIILRPRPVPEGGHRSAQAEGAPAARADEDLGRLFDAQPERTDAGSRTSPPLPNSLVFTFEDVATGEPPSDDAAPRRRRMRRG